MNKPELQNRYQLSVGGQWRDASDGEFFATKCLANGEKLAECARAAKEDVDDVVRETWKAFETRKKIPTSKHATILNKIADITDANTEHLTMVESLDNGKPTCETVAIDIPLSTEHFRYFAGCTIAEEGSANILDEQSLSLILCESIGVVGQIVPWNFPFLIATWKLAPVPVVGCCSIFKPSSDTPLSVLGFVRLVQDVIPEGVFNMITGSGSKSGQYMLGHKGLRKLAFTGSTEIGCQVVLAATGRLIPATLESGGKSASIFSPGCNWEQATDGLQLGILFSQGQVCCVGSHVLVHEDIYDKSLEDAVKAFNNVKVGASWDPETQMGSQINERQLEKILSYVGIGRQEGAYLICGGEHLIEGELAKGCFMRPTLLADVTNNMRVAQKEVFGPVTRILKFKDEDEVTHTASDNAHGFGGAVWTRDLNRAICVSRGIEAGRMWVNTYNQTPEGPPFGSYKESGAGRETHKVILEHYTQTKSIIINLSEAPSGLYPAK